MSHPVNMHGDNKILFSPQAYLTAFAIKLESNWQYTGIYQVFLLKFMFLSFIVSIKCRD
jgi:hypothetical protein